MSNGPIPHYIEPYKLVDRNVTYEGNISLTDLPRLHEALASNEVNIYVKVVFKRGEQQQALMSVMLDAKVQLICQRCLDLMTFSTTDTYNYMFMSSERGEIMLPEGYDALELGTKDPFDLKVLIEDELLLALPIIPIHELDECQQPVVLDKPEPIESEVTRSNPFSVLAQLKRDPKA
ncbi:YceD family protein [Entomomonas sp. E2T0]|uniref:YceD family protein n=1 Tax=Entomomonas sp. E2T0 TaxID=2930213 RepID=UPI0022282BD9|nr:YceD family protein [Entomomonas sp. E2T0]UYZ83003.1 YceD family protein [Entomomonas sp. E2T0]